MTPLLGADLSPPGMLEQREGAHTLSTPLYPPWCPRYGGTGRAEPLSPKEEQRHGDNSFIGAGCGDSPRYTQRNNYELNRIQTHIS